MREVEGRQENEVLDVRLVSMRIKLLRPKNVEMKRARKQPLSGKKKEHSDRG